MSDDDADFFADPAELDPSHYVEITGEGNDAPVDYSQQYNALVDDVLFDDTNADGSDSDVGFGGFNDSDSESSGSSDYRNRMRRNHKQPKKNEKKESTVRTICFDFRRGRNHWPEDCELINPQKADELLKQAEEDATKAKKDDRNGGNNTSSINTTGMFSNDANANSFGGAAGGGGGIGNTIGSGNIYSGPSTGFISGNTTGNDAGTGPTQASTFTSMYDFNDSSDDDDLENDEEVKRLLLKQHQEDQISLAPEEAEFEILKDRSTALIIKPGMRLKLDLSGLTDFGASQKRRDAKQKRKQDIKDIKNKVKAAKARAAGGDAQVPFGADASGAQPKGQKSMFDNDWFNFWNSDPWFGSAFKNYVNEYTITLDMRFESEVIPREGISLFQTALVHIDENNRTGRKILKQSNGECNVNSEGGVGIFGSYGDVSKCSIVPNTWQRVVISVRNEAEGKGTMKTWIDCEPCATIKNQEFVKDGRFAIDPESFFLFSSKSFQMMPGCFIVRHVRIEAKFCTDQQVLLDRAKDKLISIFIEERKRDIDKKRKGLALANLFPKPRPIWTSPALTGTFCDAFIEGTTFENSSLLSWSYTVMNYVLQETIKNQQKYLMNLNNYENGIVCDISFILKQSNILMKQMIKLLKHGNNSQLMLFLRKLRSQLTNLKCGETILLPALIENRELVILVSRNTDSRYDFVIIQTNPLGGLKYHAVSASAAPPKLKYRTCLVLNNINKKNALDNVFWMAVYNLAIHKHKGDTDKFYDILLPFLTGKPLESSLVEAELNANSKDVNLIGEFRSPQRSYTAYVRCILEAIHHMLCRKGLSSLKAKQINLAFRAEFLSMINNDMDYIHPSDNGQRVISMVCKQFSYCTIKLTDRIERHLQSPGKATQEEITKYKEYVDAVLKETMEVIERVQTKLNACIDDEIDLPAALDIVYDKTVSNSSVDDAGNAALKLEDTTSIGNEPTVVITSSTEGVRIKVKVKHTLKEVEKIEVDVSTEDSVDYLRQEINKIVKLQSSNLKLIFMGKVLVDGTDLKAHKINRTNLVVHLIVNENKPSASDGKVDVAAKYHEKDKKSDAPKTANHIQFQDSLAWDTEYNEPYSGQASSLKKYVPIDFMQIKACVKTRDEAVHAIRLCDKLCTLCDNQPHCIKNDKFLIVSVIQHTFSHVIPVPKPRNEKNNVDDTKLFISNRAQRRKEKALNKKKKIQQEVKHANSKDEETSDEKTKKNNRVFEIGDLVEAKYDHEDLFYKATVCKVDKEHNTYDIAYDDGEIYYNIPFEYVRTPPKEERKPEKSTKKGGKSLKKKKARLMTKEKGSKDKEGANEEETTKAKDEEEDEDDEEEEEEEEGENHAQPDFSVGQQVEEEVTKSSCIWDAEITYDLQVELLLTLQRIIEHFAAAVCSIQQTRSFDAICTVIPGCIAAIADAVIRIRASDLPSEVCSHLLGQTRDGKQLGITGFGLSVETFVIQTENIQIHLPEICIARTAVLDYFTSPYQRKLDKIFTWENAYQLRPNQALIKYMRNILREIACGEPHPHQLLLDFSPIRSKLMRNYPELCCYRDICFYFKFFLNPDRSIYPNYHHAKNENFCPPRIDRMSCVLKWTWNRDENAYEARSFGSTNLHCRPQLDRNHVGKVFSKDAPPPIHRFQSTATPSYYVSKPKIRTEEDVIYRPNLPGFEDKVTKKKTKSKTKATDIINNNKVSKTTVTHILGQHDSELLISYLTVPYIRLPLVLTFIASDDRLHKLQSIKLRDILDSVLFEPGKCLSAKLSGVEPVMVPTPHEELLATPYGMLINELLCSPEAILKSIMVLLKGALTLDTGTVYDEVSNDFSISVDIILYVSRLGCRIDNYLTFLIELATDSHESISNLMLRQFDISDDCLVKLKNGRKNIRSCLMNEFNSLFDEYLLKLDNQTRNDPNNEKLIDRNSRLACDLHAHKLMLYRNLRKGDMKVNNVRGLIGSFVYLTTRHTWNNSHRDRGALLVPEPEIYEILQVQRRRIVEYCWSLKQGELDNVMQYVLQISTSSTGSFRASDDIIDSSNRWSRVQGIRSTGRYAVASTRTTTQTNKNPNVNKNLQNVKPGTLERQVSYNKRVGAVADTGLLGVEMDIQLAQMTLRSKHLSALRTEVANHIDFKQIFGNATIQASLLEKAEKRERYRLVGMQYDIEYWHVIHSDCPPLDDQWEREYDPSELFDSESWIIPLFEPLRQAFFNGPSPPPMQFLLTETALPEDAEVAVLLGLSPAMGGPFKLVYIFRRLKCVHVYQAVTHGRQFWYTLHLTTDVRYCFRELQPSLHPRRNPLPEWFKRGAGRGYQPSDAGSKESLYDDIVNGTVNGSPSLSVVITRQSAHPENLSGGNETFIPARFLYGLVPECLLEEYLFFQDESWLHNRSSQASKRFNKQLLRGYPIDKDKKNDDSSSDESSEYVLFIEFQRSGQWSDVVQRDMFKKGAKHSHGNDGVEILGGIPGRTVRVIRRPVKKVKAFFDMRKKIAILIESLNLLYNQKSKKSKAKSATRSMKSNFNSKKIFNLTIGTKVKYEYSYNRPIDAVIVKIHEDGTYNVKSLTGSTNGLTFERVDKRDVRHHLAPARFKEGDAIWHWENMSESEDMDWQSYSEDENSLVEDNSEDDRIKKSLNFEEFNAIDELLEVVSYDIKHLEKLLYHIAAIPDTKFSSIYKLIRTVNIYKNFEYDDIFKTHINQTTTIREETHPSEAKSASTPVVERESDEDMLLLNLLYAPRYSNLFSLAKTLTRIENLSYICAWTSIKNVNSCTNYGPNRFPARGNAKIDIVELPRLKLAFTVRPDPSGVNRLYSMDHADLFVSNERNSHTTKMLAGIGHSLVMCNTKNEMFVLVPVVAPNRPIVYSQPFSTELVLNRNNATWAANINQRYFLYQVHVSLSFLMTKGIDSALYLMLLRFLHRDYNDVFRLVDSISTDCHFSKAGEVIFKSFSFCNDDFHPDAHACRLKISLVTIDSGMKLPFDLTRQCSRFVIKLPHISASCRMSLQEELQLLETEDAIVLEERDKKYDKDIHNPYMRTLVKNRLHSLRAQLQHSNLNSTASTNALKTIVNVNCFVPPRATSSAWPYYVDNTLFGEKYAKMNEITDIEQWEAALRPAEDEVPAPAKGWLVLACFHVLWNSACVRTMNTISEIAPVYPACTFVSVKADCLGIESIARDLKVTEFPTFILFRGGTEVDLSQRIVGTESTSQHIVNLLTRSITSNDEAAYVERVKHENLKLLKLNKKDDEQEEPEEEDEMEWTWDVDACGSGIRIEDLGMSICLSSEDDSYDSVQWEFAYRKHGEYQPFSPAENRELEKQYVKGNLYDYGSIDVNLKRPFSIWNERIQINSNMITGISGQFNTSPYDDFYVRRNGPRVIVKGEPEVDMQQKIRDEQMARFREHQLRYKKMLAAQRRGKDCEGVRGNSGFVLNSGVHKFVICWKSEPSRNGIGDSIGLCSENTEDFGPNTAPLLGGSKEDSSTIALYANGKLYYNGKCIVDVSDKVFCRVMKKEVTKETKKKKKPTKKEKKEEDEKADDENDDEKEKKEKKISDEDKKILELLQKCPNIISTLATVNLTNSFNLFGMHSQISCILNTDKEDGVMTFEIDGLPIEGIEIKNVFTKLGGSVVYPCISMCPFDNMDDDEDELETPKDVEADKQKENKSNDEDDEEAEERETVMKNAVSVTKLSRALLEDFENDFLEKLAVKAKKLLDMVPESPQVTLIEPCMKTDVDKANAGKDKDKAKAKKKKQKESGSEGESDESDDEAKDGESDDEEEDEEEESVDVKKSDDTVEINSEDIPIENIVYLVESENGWKRFNADICAQIEKAKRKGQQSVDIRILNARTTIKFLTTKDKKSANVAEAQSDMNDEIFKVRRHTLTAGLEGEYEILSLKYQQLLNLQGQGCLDILEKVWSKNEAMNGHECGLGFLFLYCLLQGQTRCKVISSGWGDMMNFNMFRGGFGNFGSDSSKSDSHRFATLLAQLYVDKRKKSLLPSIINVLCRNRQLCSRLPKFNDTRKYKRAPVYNGWIDEREPRSPLKELMTQLVPTLQTLRKRRGLMVFPPPPPYPELKFPDPTYELALSASVSTNRKLMQPELSNFSCSARYLQPITANEIAKLACDVGYELRGKKEIFSLMPPLKIETEMEYDTIMNELATASVDGTAKLVIACFSATWCEGCKSMEAILRVLSRTIATARFLKMDVDDCDKIADKYSVKKVPTVVFFRGGQELNHVVGTLEGYGEEWHDKFYGILYELSTDTEKEVLGDKDKVHIPKQVTKTLHIDTVESDAKMLKLDISTEEIAQFASRPLSHVNGYIVKRSREDQGKKLLTNKLPFDVSDHAVAKNSVAKSMLKRLDDDMNAWSNTSNTSQMPMIAHLHDGNLKAFFNLDENSRVEIELGRGKVISLLKELKTMRDDDIASVQSLLPLITQAANFIDLKNDNLDKIKYMLRRISGSECYIWIEYLFGSLLSSDAEFDLQKLNPYLPTDTIQTMLKLIKICVLRANRTGHINRCIEAGIKMLQLLDKTLSLTDTEVQAKQSSMLPSLIQASEDLARKLECGRYYIKQTESDYVFDPKYLIFEFTWNITLRKKQVEIVDMFMSNIQNGNISKVKQMIMGAGKTTVVAPLLALMLADGKSLVLSVVPKALLEMSRKRMRETFATIMQKRIYTLKFDRNTTVHPSMCRSLENAKKNRGVVVATPTAVKSIMLSYVETLKHLDEQQSLNSKGGVKTEVIKNLEAQATELAKILQLFREGSMLLDEVDLILHPLKSELNFPVGEKFSLDVSEQGERFTLPIHLLDAIFYAECNRISTFEQRGQAVEIVRKLSVVIEQGYQSRSLQKLPHIILLNTSFYHHFMKPILAEWAYLWLQKQHLHGIDHSETIRYILDGAAPKSSSSNRVKLLEEEYGEFMKKANKQLSDDEQMCKKMLQEAIQSAIDQRNLSDEVYKLQDEYEEYLSDNAEHVGTLQSRIAQLTSEIEEAQYPRDDSLDNAVIVWLSNVFNVNRGGTSHDDDEDDDSDNNNTSSSLQEESAEVHLLCNQLEDMGFKIKRCDESDEAISRAFDLYETGQLRCVIISSNDGGFGCTSTCNEEHDQYDICTRCDLQYEDHTGHMCDDEQRGSFTSYTSFGDADANVDDYVTLDVLSSLTSTSTKKSIAADRCLAYCKNRSMHSDDRIQCWNLNVTVADTSENLIQFIEAVEDYGSKKEDVKEEDENPAADGDDLPEPPVFERRESIGTLKLKDLKGQLEKLELEKTDAVDKEESQRKKFKLNINSAYRKLRSCVEERIKMLKNSINSKVPFHIIKKIREINNANLLKMKTKRYDFVSSSHKSLAWICNNSSTISTCTEVDESNNLFSKISYCVNHIENEIKLLEQTLLGAKVIGHVSLQHKKLLNLTHDWLATFLPHTLAKINRVSFGLLNESDCLKALEVDALMPRSRLKLAVPFVGKDVPSASSEFAHPDVIIGLSVLAYRYSGLRRSDFEILVDALTAEFANEIGPARERASSRRYESWVNAAGGSIRGVKVQAIKNQDGDQKEQSAEVDDKFDVVQLKYLQKSNSEQMDKLYELFLFEPLVIHFYLNHFIFPAHMRSQRTKISASCQAIGGNMLFKTRVGFSGTPSDLLPKELGKCDYETGDDGKMLQTVIDPEITSYHYMEKDWNVEKLLKHIACSTEPRYHALIDTGALITGYSNFEVAETLLDRGLSWCDGIVFLDDDDKQQVLVRATNRVVSADQCGIPLERRFAFYDQIHTTGMDIQHVVNATAVITLGKDMVFRDYVQGAFRMRGIGQGQKISVFIIPEISELIRRELATLKEDVLVTSDIDEKDTTLTDLVAWLIINSMRSESIQYNMLCMQNIANIYRKNGFWNIHSLYNDKVAKPQIKDTKVDYVESLKIFDEPVDFSLEATVPDRIPFCDKLNNMINDHDEFIINDVQRQIADQILQEVMEHTKTDEGKNTSQRLESEQEREQEQEQEKEVKQRRDQQIEVEKFIDREYSRNNEVPKAWPFSILSQVPPIRDNTRKEVDYPFYQLKNFRLRHHEQLDFPKYLYTSRNYYNPTWTGLRRLKNVIMMLEFVPSMNGLRMYTGDELNPSKLNKQAQNALEHSYKLLAARTGELSRIDVYHAINAATDCKISDSQLDDIILEFGNNRDALSLDGFKSLLLSNRLRQVQDGRYYCAISLAEAQTIRRILHIRRFSSSNVLIPNCDTNLALRYTPISTFGSTITNNNNVDYSNLNKLSVCDVGLILDASNDWIIQNALLEDDNEESIVDSINVNATGFNTHVPTYQALVAHNCARFFDCSMHFTQPSLNVLVRELQNNSIYNRERFFYNVIGCKRRMERKFQETPLAKVFTVSDEYNALKFRAQAVFIREAIKNKRLTLWEAFVAFDADDNGVLSPAEFYGAVKWLGLPDLTPEDVVDMIEAADSNRDGLIDYKEYTSMLKDPDDDEQDEDEGEDSEMDNSTATGGIKKKSKVLVEPFGAEILREIMVLRRRKELLRQRQDRMRRAAYQKALDIKIFEEELQASNIRVGGANPLLQDVVFKNPEHGPAKVKEAEFRFNSFDKPLRTTTNGNAVFAALLGNSVSTPATTRRKAEVKCKRGHSIQSYYSSWTNCTECKARGVRYRCGRGRCNQYLCKNCYNLINESRKKEFDNLKYLHTYIKCSAGSSFVVQIPSHLSIKHQDSSTLQPIESINSTDSFDENDESNAQQMYDVKIAQFTLTLELMIEKLPPKNNMTALVKFSPASVNRVRKKNHASLYVNSRGILCDADGVEDNANIVLTEKEDKSNLVQQNKWHVVTVAVDTMNETMNTYVDGSLCSSLCGLNAEDIYLQHQLILFGGAKQGHLRGGNIRRILIHNKMLGEAEVAEVTAKCLASMKTRVIWCDFNKSTKHDEIIATLNKFNITVDRFDDSESALQAIQDGVDSIHCVMLPLSKEMPKKTPEELDAEKEAAKKVEVIKVDLNQEQELEANQAMNKELSTEDKMRMHFGVDFAEKVRQISKNLPIVMDMAAPVKEKPKAEKKEDKQFLVGDKIEARFNKKKKWYKGVIDAVNDDGSFNVLYDDGDEEKQVEKKFIKPRKLPLPASEKHPDLSESELKAVLDMVKEVDCSFTADDLECALIAKCSIDFRKKQMLKQLDKDNKKKKRKKQSHNETN